MQLFMSIGYLIILFHLTFLDDLEVQVFLDLKLDVLSNWMPYLPQTPNPEEFSSLV
jgi:hypothetical protein